MSPSPEVVAFVAFLIVMAVATAVIFVLDKPRQEKESEDRADKALKSTGHIPHQCTACEKVIPVTEPYCAYCGAKQK